MTQETAQQGRPPLQGVRVADFTWLWAGAYATGLLALLGAEVIKIESMNRVDQTRTMTFTLGKAFEGVEQSAVFNTINLNKLSVKLNLKRPEAVELAKRIVQISDVAAENMRPGAMDSLGLGYDVLKSLKPDIIMLSSSAFGSKGPYRTYGGYAPGFACGSGLANLTGYADDTPNPMTGSTDLMAAITGAFAIVAALNYKQQTGRGQHIDLSSVESQAALAGDALMEYLLNGRVQHRQGNHDKIMAPHNCYRCRGEDKWVSIAVLTPEEWSALRDGKLINPPNAIGKSHGGIRSANVDVLRTKGAAGHFVRAANLHPTIDVVVTVGLMEGSVDCLRTGEKTIVGCLHVL